MKQEAGRLFYDPESGELVGVVFSDKFKWESALLRADVLKDALGVLTADYVDAVSHIFKAPLNSTETPPTRH